MFDKLWRFLGGMWGVLMAVLFAVAIFMLHHPLIEKIDGKTQARRS